MLIDASNAPSKFAQAEVWSKSWHNERTDTFGFRFIGFYSLIISVT